MTAPGDIPLNARSLSYRWLGRRYALELDDDYLTCTWRVGPESQMSKTPLWRLLPELLLDQSFPEASRWHARRSRNLIIAAVVVYFSDIRLHVPLLVPALLILGLLSFYRGVRSAFPLGKTRVITDYAEEIAVIPHHESSKTQRKAFEQALLAAIRNARENRAV